MYWRIDKHRLGVSSSKSFPTHRLSLLSQLYRCAVDAGFSPASLKGKNKCAPPEPIAEFVYNAKHLTGDDGFRTRHLYKGNDFLRLPVSGNEILDTELIRTPLPVTILNQFSYFFFSSLVPLARGCPTWRL